MLMYVGMDHYSPQDNVTYDKTSIPLEVYADQTIVVWMYSLNDKLPVVFTPNTTINVEAGVIEGLIILIFYIKKRMSVKNGPKSYYKGKK